MRVVGFAVVEVGGAGDDAVAALVFGGVVEDGGPEKALGNH